MIQDVKYFGQDVFLVTIYIQDPKGNPIQFIRPLTGKEPPAFMHQLVTSTHRDLVDAFGVYFNDYLVNHAKRLQQENPFVGPNSQW